jgi:hypothetical protein
MRHTKAVIPTCTIFSPARYDFIDLRMSKKFVGIIGNRNCSWEKGVKKNRRMIIYKRLM